MMMVMEDDAGAILRQISSSKILLDQVNEEIEENIQRTREIESEIVKCDEIEKNLLLRESELMKIISVKEFDLAGLTQVVASGRTSLELMKKEVALLSINKEEMLKRMNNSRDRFVAICEQFQREIVSGESEELKRLLLEKAVREKEILNLNTKICALKNSTSACVEEVLEELNKANAELQAQIRHGNQENVRLEKSINDLKSTLLALDSVCHPC